MIPQTTEWTQSKNKQNNIIKDMKEKLLEFTDSWECASVVKYVPSMQKILCSQLGQKKVSELA